jgi:hypothetical protein
VLLFIFFIRALSLFAIEKVFKNRNSAVHWICFQFELVKAHSSIILSVSKLCSSLVKAQRVIFWNSKCSRSTASTAPVQVPARSRCSLSAESADKKMLSVSSELWWDSGIGKWKEQAEHESSDVRWRMSANHWTAAVANYTWFKAHWLESNLQFGPN